MTFGAKILSKGATGPEVEELQLRLAGFRGTLWDGEFGPGTELQVIAFQRDYLKMENPSGIADEATYQGLDRFAQEFPIDFAKLQCPNCQCQGFGQNRFQNEFLSGKAQIEVFHKCEYPGIHKAVLHTFRAIRFYTREAGLGEALITSGYRCWIKNEEKGRTTTNHLGKAIDFDFPMNAGEDKRDDCQRCDAVRGLLVEKSNCQIGWGANNLKALEPSNIAPTWIHLDVRCYEPKYLANKYFVKTAEELERKEI